MKTTKTTKIKKQLRTKSEELANINTGIADLIEISLRSLDRLNAHPIAKEKFPGNGVYALYYTGDHPLYKDYSAANSKKLKAPIFIDSALKREQKIGRSGKKADIGLYEKIREQYRNIAKTTNLNPGDFYFKALVLDTEHPGVGKTIESALVKHYKPLWNECLEGIGNHNPGKGRMRQAPSSWDVIHPGREWVSKLKGTPECSRRIKRRVKKHMSRVKDQLAQN